MQFDIGVLTDVVLESSDMQVWPFNVLCNAISNLSHPAFNLKHPTFKFGPSAFSVMRYHVCVMRYPTWDIQHSSLAIRHSSLAIEHVWCPLTYCGRITSPPAGSKKPLSYRRRKKERLTKYRRDRHSVMANFEGMHEIIRETIRS